jgi:NADP-dependent 3-hydroxy acid dehydrogenase YdfG
MSYIRGQVAMVTGAGSGIGKAIALSLAAEGVVVCLVGRTKASLDAVAVEAQAKSLDVRVCPTDLTVDEQIEQLRAYAEREFGKVDVLVHCAGIISRGKTLEVKVQDFDSQYHANVRGPYLLTQCLLPLLKVTPGQVVFINSSVGLQARAGVGQFAATQHSMKAIADSLRDEINEDGIRVLSIFPGRTATPRQEIIFASEGRQYRPELLLQPEDVAAVVINALSLPRTAEVTEISIRPLLKSY